MDFEAIEIGTPVEELDTPCAIVDLDRMEANIVDWQSAIAGAGAQLRPHIKTHKVPAIGQLQIAAGACGITVAKLSEAQVFADAGCDDIFVAYPLMGEFKWARAAQLAGQIRLIVGADSEFGVRGLSAAADAAGTTIGVRIEVNSGLNRAGVDAEAVLPLCRLVEELPGLELDGIFTFRSVYYSAVGEHTAQSAGHEEGTQLAELAAQLRAQGVKIDSVSAGSTPTARWAAAVEGVTEVRPGTYVFGDYMMAETGFTPYENLALSVLTIVVSRPAPDRATIDGGSKTFGGDIVPDRYGLKGYARVVGREAFLESMSEEHGVVRLEDDFPDLNLGDKIALYPAHVCTAVNLCDELVGARDGRVEVVWAVAARGKRR